MLAYIISFCYNGALLVSAVIVLLCICLFIFQDKMIYQPNPVTINLPTPDMNPEGYRNPMDRGMAYEDVYVRTSDNLRIHLWLIRRPEADAPTIIYFHGNAGNIGFRLDVYEQIYKNVKANVIAASYRGYGYSEGKPNELGIYLDADAIIEYALHCGVNPKKIVLFGASLGGAVTIYSAQKNKEIAGIILENTFTSMADLVDHLMPKVALFKSLILRNYWPSILRIPSITCPILFIAGVKDELIPHTHMLKLFEAAQSSYKEMVFFYLVPSN